MLGTCHKTEVTQSVLTEFKSQVYYNVHVSFEDLVYSVFLLWGYFKEQVTIQ